MAPCSIYSKSLIQCTFLIRLYYIFSFCLKILDCEGPSSEEFLSPRFLMGLSKKKPIV